MKKKKENGHGHCHSQSEVKRKQNYKKSNNELILCLQKGQLKPYLAPIHDFKPQTETDLIYLHSSPDFCEPNDKIGSLGTHGRQCNRTSKAIDGWSVLKTTSMNRTNLWLIYSELMCCGRGYKTRIEKVEDRCNCKFHWCCYVECDRCFREVEVNTCL